jgi:hypothetical protein
LGTAYSLVTVIRPGACCDGFSLVRFMVQGLGFRV